MRIAVASGKGGTGKTTVAVNLAVAAARFGQSVHLCDCDVEEPNAHLFLEPAYERTWQVTVPVPRIDPEACSHCGRCADICEFNAIACLPDRTLVFPDLCHSCSGCWLVCPHQAITPADRPVGTISSGAAGDLTFTTGRMKIGQTQVPAMIEAVKDVPGNEAWIFLDAPPGTTCPVGTTLRDADFVVLVTEPTPFGLHDLTLALELTRRLGVPCGVVVNRCGDQPGLVEDFCLREGVDLLARIPFSRRYAEICAEGGLILDADREAAEILTGLFRSLKSREAAA